MLSILCKIFQNCINYEYHTHTRITEVSFTAASMNILRLRQNSSGPRHLANKDNDKKTISNLNQLDQSNEFVQFVTLSYANAVNMGITRS